MVQRVVPDVAGYIDTDDFVDVMNFVAVDSNTASKLNYVRSSFFRNMWVGTQAEYDAIVTKDAATQYNIVAA